MDLVKVRQLLTQQMLGDSSLNSTPALLHPVPAPATSQTPKLYLPLLPENHAPALQAPMTGMVVANPAAGMPVAAGQQPPPPICL